MVVSGWAGASLGHTMAGSSHDHNEEDQSTVEENGSNDNEQGAIYPYEFINYDSPILAQVDHVLESASVFDPNNHAPARRNDLDEMYDPGNDADDEKETRDRTSALTAGERAWVHDSISYKALKSARKQRDEDQRELMKHETYDYFDMEGTSGYRGSPLDWMMNMDEMDEEWEMSVAVEQPAKTESRAGQVGKECVEIVVKSVETDDSEGPEADRRKNPRPIRSTDLYIRELNDAKAAREKKTELAKKDMATQTVGTDSGIGEDVGETQ